MRRITLCLFLIVLLVTGFFARGFLASAIFEWYIKGYCSTCLQGDLAYDKLHYENGTWILDEPSLTSFADLQQGGNHFHAKHAVIQASISWLERRLDLDIAFDDLQVDIGSEGKEIKNLLKIGPQEFNLLTVYSHFSIPQASVTFSDCQGNSLLDKSLYFSFDITCHQSKEGCLAVWYPEKENDEEGKKHIEIGISASPSDALQISMHVNDIGSSECLALLGHFCPSLADFKAVDGVIRGHAVFSLPSDALPYGKGEFFVEDLHLQNDTSEWDCRIPKLTMVLSPQQIDSDSLDSFQTLLQLKAATINGEIEIYGNDENEIGRFDFTGKATDIVEMLPHDLRHSLDKKFGNDEFKIKAEIIRGLSDTSMIGKFLLIDKSKRGTVDEFDFGFSFKNTCPAIKDGWFKGNHIPLEKFVSPFLFPQNQISLSGVCEFQGVFDEKQITLNYDACDLILENDNFCIDVKNLNGDADQPHHVGTYVFNFKDSSNMSCLPIANGTYFEKNSGLLFTDIHTTVILEDEKAHFSDLEAFCNGILFGGTIELDWSMPGDGVFDVDIYANTMQGKVSQVQSFLSHFNDSSFFLKLPVDGDMEFRKEGALLHFSFFDGDYVFQTKLDGAMSDGALPSLAGDVSVQELSLNFCYDHQASLLEFSDIQGTLLVGSPGHVEEYAIAGDQVCFSNYANNEATFDLWIGDKKRDLLRLAGKTEPLSSNDNNEYIAFTFDRDRSHFGNVHPLTFELMLKNWSDVETFHLNLDFHMKTLLRDLQRFSRTGLFFLSRSVLQELNDIPAAEGNFKVDLQYDGQKGVFAYNTEGSKVAIGTYTAQQFAFNGKKKGNLWTIDQLQFDNISFAADILKNDSAWNINFLGIRAGESFLAGLEGCYRDEEATLEAKINLLEVDLASLDEWPLLKSMLEEYRLSGRMRANGYMKVLLDKSLPQNMRINAHLDCAVRNGSWSGLHFQDFENASIDYTSDQGLCLSNVNTALKSPKDHSIQADIAIKSITSHFQSNEVTFDSLAFQIPSSNLPWFSENLQQSFPNFISPSIVEIIRDSKSQGQVKGMLNLELSQPYCALRLTLDDGSYNFMQREHDVSNFILEYDPCELKIFTKYRFERHQFWLTARSSSPEINRGEIILSEQILDSYDSISSFPLTINWEFDQTNGLILHKLEGCLSGVTCDLVRDENHPLSPNQLFLNGEIYLDMSKAQALISPELASACTSWEVGQGYLLKGQWALAKNERSFSERLTFQGELLGRNFEFGGYQFYNLSAQVGYSGNALRAAHVSMNDPSGGMHINDMMLSKLPEDKWFINVPTITLSDFRPSLLHPRGAPPPRSPKTLIIRHCDVRDFQGILGDRNSYSGKGRLLFTNPPKKHLQHTIFALPAEIMTRLGLDFAVLNPVRGLIYYDIKDSKVVFSRFKDVYSKGRLSKFYLSNAGPQSYMDFDGNLNLQIRMKQYNLFFKFAELFTVTVQGNIKKPTYSLYKQPRSPRSLYGVAAIPEE